MNKKILVIKNDKIGDMVFASGVFREIKKSFPSAIIDVVASPENRALIEKNKNINKIYTLRYAPNSLKEIYNYFLISSSIKKENYDIGIEMRGSFFNIFFLLFLSGIKYKTGFYFKSLSKIFLNLPIKRDITKHENLLMLNLINKSLGTKVKDFLPDIEVDKEDVKAANSFIKKHKLNKFICIVPEASSPTKQWSLKNTESIIKFLRQNYPKYKILLVGKDTENIRRLLKNNNFCIPLVNKNLREVYLLFKKSSLVIAPDGGPMHLAWASKTRVIAIMLKDLTIENIKPLGKNSAMVIGDMDRITVKEVENKINKMLKTYF